MPLARIARSILVIIPLRPARPLKSIRTRVEKGDRHFAAMIHLLLTSTALRASPFFRRYHQRTSSKLLRAVCGSIPSRHCGTGL